MRWAQAQKLEVYARATRGLMELEPNPERQLKYIDFIDIYSSLDDNEQREYRQRYTEENTAMTTLSQRLRSEGSHDCIEGMLRKLIMRKFGDLPDWADARLQSATDAQMEAWVGRILDADSLDELLAES